MLSVEVSEYLSRLNLYNQALLPVEINQYLLMISAYNQALKVISGRKIDLSVSVYFNKGDINGDLENLLKYYKINYNSIVLDRVSEDFYENIIFEDFFSRIKTVTDVIVNDLRHYLTDYYGFMIDNINNSGDRLSKSEMYLVDRGLNDGDIVLIAVFHNFVVFNFVEYFT